MQFFVERALNLISSYPVTSVPLLHMWTYLARFWQFSQNSRWDKNFDVSPSWFMELSVWRGIWLPEDILSVSVYPGNQAVPLPRQDHLERPSQESMTRFSDIDSWTSCRLPCRMIRRKQDNLAVLEGRAVITRRQIHSKSYREHCKDTRSLQNNYPPWPVLHHPNPCSRTHNHRNNWSFEKEFWLRA